MNKLTSRLHGLWPVLVAGCLATAGCMSTGAETDFQSDGTAGLMNQEVSSMHGAYSSESGKIATDSAQAEIVLTTLHYDTSCMCFVRAATFAFTTPRGKSFVRERLDSIWLQDSTGAYLDTFTPLQADTITHHRHVVKVNGAMDVNLQINTVTTWVRNDDGTRTGTLLSGTISGTFGGVPFKHGVINGVYHSFLGGWSGYPTAGTIHLEHGDYVFDLTFKGDGKAGVDVTGNGTATHIECDGGNETEGN